MIHLLSYQKKLHEIIIASTSTDAEGEHEQRPEVKIKAITELHAIEVTLFPNVEAATKSICE